LTIEWRHSSNAATKLFTAQYTLLLTCERLALEYEDVVGDNLPLVMRVIVMVVARWDHDGKLKAVPVVRRLVKALRGSHFVKVLMGAFASFLEEGPPLIVSLSSP
jgi:hypothetical protein